MAENTIQKVREWLSYQEEVYGPFKVPHATTALTGIKAEETLSGKRPAETAADAVATHTGKTADEPEHAASALMPDTDYNRLLSGIKTLDELRDLCLRAEILRTDLDGTNLVFGVGNPEADLMLVGEAPGEQEDRQGEPFVGAAGQLLNKILRAIQFEREQVYIANILKHRPPNNRDPLPAEREKSLPFLIKQIELINPKLILCLGRVSAHTLLGTTVPMKDLRGRFHLFMDRYELMVTFHPAALLRNPAWKRDTWADVQLLRKRYDEIR